MKPRDIANARINSTMLGIEDHGIFTAWLTLSGEGWGQGFGGYALDSYDAVLGRRIDSNGYGLEFVRGVMRAVGVDSWEKLKGSLVRVEREDGLIVGIGHIVDDMWFYPRDLKVTR